VAGSSDLGFEILSSLHDDDETPNKPPTLNLPCVMLEAKMSDPGQVFLGRQSILDTIQDALVKNMDKKSQYRLR